MTSLSPSVIGYIGDVAGIQRAFLFISGIVLLAAIPIVSLYSDRVYVNIEVYRERAD